MIKAIVFDLGRVLLDIDLSRGLLGGMGVVDERIINKLGQEEHFIAYSTGKITSREFYEIITAKYHITMEYEVLALLWCNIFNEMAGMRQVVADLSGSYPLGLLSDTDPLHWNHIKENFPWIQSYFKKPVLSFEIGAMKPDMSCFELAAESVGVSTSECIFIDDLEKNIAGAVKAGMTGIHFEGVKHLKEKLAELGIDL